MQIQKTTAFNPSGSAQHVAQKRPATVAGLDGEKKEVEPIHAVNKIDRGQPGLQGYLAKQDALGRVLAGDQNLFRGHAIDLFQSNLDPKSRQALNAYLNHQNIPHQEERSQLQRLFGVGAYV